MKSLFIAGNWKSNKTTEETNEWLKGFMVHGSWFMEKSDTLTGVVCAPFTVLSTLKQGIRDHKLPFSLGAQNVSKFDEGAYTGEVSARMIKEVADWALVGHSERRKYQGETDEDLAIKVEKAKNAGLGIIYCVPDAKTPVPAGVDVVAYEPVWAIGTGESDTPDNADGVSAAIKQKTGVKMVIYGGSVSPQNVASFCAMSHIDGVLPGGASLDPATFSQLLKEADVSV